MYLDRFCVAVSLMDLDASLTSQVLRYYPGERLVMERLGLRGWGQLRISSLRLKGDQTHY